MASGGGDGCACTRDASSDFVFNIGNIVFNSIYIGHHTPRTAPPCPAAVLGRRIGSDGYTERVLRPSDRPRRRLAVWRRSLTFQRLDTRLCRWRTVKLDLGVELGRRIRSGEQEKAILRPSGAAERRAEPRRPGPPTAPTARKAQRWIRPPTAFQGGPSAYLPRRFRPDLPHRLTLRPTDRPSVCAGARGTAVAPDSSISRACQRCQRQHCQ